MIRIDKKLIGMLVWSLLFALWIGNGFAYADSLPVSKQTASSPVTAGVDVMTYESTSGGGKALVYVLKVDLTNPYVKLDTIVGNDGTFAKNQVVSNMANRVGAVAAINGDFFQMGTSGRPIGLTYQNGTLLSSPAQRTDMYGFALMQSKVPLIDIFTFSGQVTAANGNSFTLSGINKPAYLVMGGASSDAGTLQLYNTDWGSSSRGGGNDVVEMVISNQIVQEIRNNLSATTIPMGGYVLRGQGAAASFLRDNFQIGDTVQVSYAVGPVDQIQAAVGGQALLIHNGSIPNSFSQEITGRVARTALGYTADGRTLYLACAEKSSNSQGMTQWEMAYFLSGLGAHWAINLDGGGSTTMVARPLAEKEVSLLTKPQGGSQRQIPTAIGLFSTAPPGKLAGLLVDISAEIFLVVLPYTLTVKGYDEYYNTDQVGASELKWSFKNGTGNVVGNQLTFETGGAVTVVASNGVYDKEIPVQVYDEKSINRLDVEPSEIRLTPGGSVQCKVKVVCNDGTEFSLQPGQYQLSASGLKGSVSGDTYTAPATPGIGVLQVNFRGITKDIPITVAEGQQVIGKSTENAPLSLTLDGLTVVVPAEGLPAETTVIMKPLTTLSTPLPEGYQLVTGVEITADMEGKEFLKPAAVQWQNNQAVLLQLQEGQWVSFSTEEMNNAQISTLEPLALVLKKAAPVFTDMEGHWAKTDVTNLSVKGIVSGFPGNVFMPQDKVTRVQFITMLAKAMNWLPTEGNTNFTDSATIPDWAKGYVGIAVQKGVISGYNDGTFKPNRTITRSEMASCISRALNLPEASADTLAGFVDRNAVAQWALDPVSRTVGAGLLKGDNQQRFNPKGLATRAESAALIARTMEYLAQYHTTGEIPMENA